MGDYVDIYVKCEVEYFKDLPKYWTVQKPISPALIHDWSIYSYTQMSFLLLVVDFALFGPSLILILLLFCTAHLINYLSINKKLKMKFTNGLYIG